MQCTSTQSRVLSCQYEVPQSDASSHTCAECAVGDVGKVFSGVCPLVAPQNAGLFLALVRCCLLSVCVS
jgi:hypothetical protein